MPRMAKRRKKAVFGECTPSPVEEISMVALFLLNVVGRMDVQHVEAAFM